MKITTNSVDVSPLFYQIPTSGELGVDRCPMKRRTAAQSQHNSALGRKVGKRDEHVLVISVVHGGISGLEELLDGIKIASLGSRDDLLLGTASVRDATDKIGFPTKGRIGWECEMLVPTACSLSSFVVGSALLLGSFMSLLAVAVVVVVVLSACVEEWLFTAQ